MTLAAFLLARIAEDEAVAREATPDTLPHPLLLVEAEDRDMVCELMVDPARVLAECEAKRRIVEGHGRTHACTVLGEPDAWDEQTFWEKSEPCPTLRALAAVYADHEDSRDEWR